MELLLSDLRTKEIIRIESGERIGYANDIEIDKESGKVISLIVPGAYKAFGLFGKEDDTLIPWEKITKIGEDFIIVS